MAGTGYTPQQAAASGAKVYDKVPEGVFGSRLGRGSQVAPRRDLGGITPQQTDEIGMKLYEMISNTYDLPPAQGGMNTPEQRPAARPTPQRQQQSPMPTRGSMRRSSPSRPMRQMPTPNRPPQPMGGMSQRPMGSRVNQIVAQRQQGLPMPQMQQPFQPFQQQFQAQPQMYPPPQPQMYAPLVGGFQPQQAPYMAFNPYQNRF